MTAAAATNANPAVNKAMLKEVLGGLQQLPKTLPAKYFYDDDGAALFEKICELPEYYPTRTELAILRDHAADMAACLGDDCMLVEPGSGAGEKARYILREMNTPAGFAPIDVAAEQLERVADNIHNELQQLPVYPTVGDFSKIAELPDLPVGNRAIFFPGSTIGNFAPAAATALLNRFGQLAGQQGKLLIGVDLVKPIDELEAAYNDSAGITAEFNLNMLRHINRELFADFDLTAFKHQAPWQPEHSAIRMELISQCEQRVVIGDESVDFSMGEAIHTEYSHKYSVDDFDALLKTAGWQVQRCWQDNQQRFAVFLADWQTT